MSDPDARARLVRAIELELRATAATTGVGRLSPEIAKALRAVPREAFVPAEARELAHVNRPLPIGHGQTISQPFIVALMTELLAPHPEHAVLEIGTGSGYQAAILARLVRAVYSIECIPALAQRAATVLAAQGCANVQLRTGDGNLGWPEHAPYDGIIVTAAAPAIPPALLAQLRPGGRMVIPLGPEGGHQVLTLVTRDAAGTPATRPLLDVAFVPLVDTEG
jgi:protein-L-isoaspartate(D-aspartate) O-methyltransferase